jgi:hypothetical protein
MNGGERNERIWLICSAFWLGARYASHLRELLLIIFSTDLFVKLKNGESVAENDANDVLLCEVSQVYFA